MKTPKKAKPKPKRARAPKGGITFAGKFYRGGCFIPEAAVAYLEGHKRPQRPQPAGVDDEALVLIAMSELPTSTEAALSMHRYLTGRATQRDRTILDGRRLQAIETLRDHAGSDQEWTKWNNAYIATAKGVS